MSGGFDQEALSPSLWQQALEALSDEDKNQFRTSGSESGIKPTDVLVAVEEKKKYCEEKQWVFYVNDAGEKILVRDTLNKVVNWLDKFKQVGDAAVQYDPGHAALPWMAIRFLLQASLNDCETFGNMLEGIESVSRIVARYTELETKVLLRTSSLTKELAGALVKLYGSALKFLALASRYYGKGTLRRIFKSTLYSSSKVVAPPMLLVEKDEEDVYKLVRLVQDEIAGSKLDDIVKSIQETLQSSQVSNEARRRRLSAWIGGIDTKNTYETSLYNHHDGTCEWVVELPEFQAWSADDDSHSPRLLWIHGPPGFGKTILTASVIQHLKRKERGSVSYFFCVADNQLTRDPYSILRSWLEQILEQHEITTSIMEAIYKARGKEQTLTQLGLWDLFVTVGQAVDGLTFVIDGFDECTTIDMGAQYHHSEPRNLFLHELLKSLEKTKSRLLVVSRDVPDIREYLGNGTAASKDYAIETFEYAITAKDTCQDVLSFSTFVIGKKLANKKENLRQDIANQAADRSQGMFLWIKLLEEKILPGKNAKALKQIVTHMPSGITETYSRELEGIISLPFEERSRAIMILRWVLFAVRPLQVKQLAEAIVVSGDDLDEYPDDDLPDCWHNGFVDEEYVKQMLLTCCGSLLQLRSSSSEVPLADYTVHFVHFSVKEYLLSLSTSAADHHWARQLGLSDTLTEELRLSNICLRYLTLKTFEDMSHPVRMYPFLSYAAWAWYFHSYHEKPAPTPDIMKRTQKAFDPTTSSWKVWTPLMEAEMAEPDTHYDKDDVSESYSVITFETVPNEEMLDEIVPDEELNDETMHGEESISETASLEEITSAIREGLSIQEFQTPIYFASFLGLIDVVKWLEDQGLDCNGQGGLFGCPLQAAVARNHEELVMHLLDRHVDVCQAGGKFGAPINAAAALSSTTIVRALLNANADLTVTDDNGYTALHHAVKRGNLNIVQELLDHGADINAVTKLGSSAAWLACFFEHSEILSHLAQLGAQLDTNGENGKPPLQVAVEHGAVQLVDILLTNGILANTLFPDGSTPLTRAFCSSNMVKKLLAKGASPNMTDGSSRKPLYFAVASQNLDVAVELFKGGAVIGGPDSALRESNLLQIAVAKGDVEMAKLLLENGADIHQKAKGCVTAIMVAIWVGDLNMVEWLLDVGTSLQGAWETNQQTLFDLAKESAEDSIVRTLVRRRCFQIRTPGSDNKPAANPALEPLGDDSLVMMAYNNDTDGIQAKMTNSNETVASNSIAESLEVASALGHLSVVKALLRFRVKINLLDINGRTALHYATAHSHFKIADLLIEKGASVCVEDNIGSTPIDLAMLHGKQAAEFIRNNMSGLILNISRRPSLLATSPNLSGNLHVLSIRKSMCGAWAGHYEYLTWWKNRQEPFSMNIPEKPLPNSGQSTFFHENEDLRGAFEIHGFVDSIGTLWFVKLYHDQGWLYRGQLDADGVVLRGTWGSNRHLWFGTFLLAKTQTS